MKNFFKNLKRYALCFAAVAVFAVFASVPVSAAEEGLGNVGFIFSVETEDGFFSCNIKCGTAEVAAENRWLLSMPKAAEGTEVTVQIREGSITVDGRTLSDGDVITALSKGEHIVTYKGSTYYLDVFYGSDIPSIYIFTENGMEGVLADKAHKEGGQIYILNGDKFEYAGVLDYIKGRGNHTWTLEKKPFNIKLDEKADLFGMGENKGWSLLANYVDGTHLKNRIIYDFADAVGLNYSSKSVHADLYIDSEYYGLYTITEKVEIGDNRVEITNLEDLNEEANPDTDIEECELMGTRGEESALEKGSYKWVDIPNNPEDITGGYLLEFELDERYDNEVSGFVTNYGQPIVVKSPEYASKEQVEYIRSYWQEFEDAVLSDTGYNEKGKHYSDYMDMESMAKMYVYFEYAKNMEVGLSSFYFYKEAGEKLVAGPVWDFDKALGHAYKFGSIELGDPTGFLATGSRNDVGGMSIVSLLCRFPEFRQLAAQQWEEYFVPNIDGLVDSVDKLHSETKDSAIMDKNKWTEGFVRTTAEVPQWYGDQVIRLKYFLETRADFMSDNFAVEKLYVQYAANGGEGLYLNKDVYDAGDTVEVKENKFTYDTEFLGYNTRADGKGQNYMPGDTFEITENVTLYAQWKKKSIFERIAEFFDNLF
ncbi:MAG: hypothetical protein E7488_02445 [Ruminococcaceae bacterium]|nr:hypothetical protein [Oscillospiraceae bacterium]